MKGNSGSRWKSVASAIHPPLPLNARDSRHLLSLLNTSFTEALDKQHPKVSSEGRKNTTDQHLHSILSSPIFGPESPANRSPSNHSPPSKKHARTTATQLSKSATHEPFESNSIANAMIEANLKSFRHEILIGRADLAKAIVCLRRSIDCLMFTRKKYGSHAVDGFGKHGMASMMLNWLWSSGLEKSDEFLLHNGFLPLLSPFLVAEGRVEEAMQWFWRLGAKATLCSSDESLPMDDTMAVCLENVERSQEQLLLSYHQWDQFESPKFRCAFKKFVGHVSQDGCLSNWPRALLRQRQQAILYHLVLYSLLQGPNKSLNSAINIFVQAISPPNVVGMSPMELISVFRPAGKLIVKQVESGWKADQSGYDAFSSTVPFWNNANALVRSIVKLHDPNNPDWKPAYLFLTRLTPTMVKRSFLWERPSMVLLGLDTAKMLISHGGSSYSSKAMKIMQSLQQHFGDELGVLPTSVEEIRKTQHIAQVEPMEADFALA